MVAVKAMDLRDNLKTYCEQVIDGETLIVSRPGNKNVVVISEAEYNALHEAKKQQELLKLRTRVLTAEASRLAGEPTYTLDEVFGDNDD